MNVWNRKLAGLGQVFVVVLAALVPTRADDLSVVPVTFPAPFYLAQQPGETTLTLDNILEASGVEPIGDGQFLLVAHDKKVPLRVIETSTGKQIGPLLSSGRFPAETPKSSKWEGMARDLEGNYYLVGSHSGDTEGERREHAKLIRFRVNTQAGINGGLPSFAIDDCSVISWQLSRPLVQALQNEGLGTKAIDQRKIEGLAIREYRSADGTPRRELAIGLRQPDDLVRAFATDITGPPSEGVDLPLTRLFAFDPGECEGNRCQLTSMEYLPSGKGFLVITATEDDQNAFHGNMLWFVPDNRIAQGNGPSIPADKVWTFEVAMKAEGLCILPPTAGHLVDELARLLVTYDNDPHSTHIPSRFQMVNLRNRTAAH